jgi:NADH-quinone oxidoreductase subunit G
VQKETHQQDKQDKSAHPTREATPDLVSIWIDGRELQAPKGTKVVDVARENGIEILTLCYLKGVSEPGCCRVCLVEVEGARRLQASCVTPVREGMKVQTNTPRVRRARRRVVELLLTEHNQECPVCPRSETCELRKVASDVGLRRTKLPVGRRKYKIHDQNPFMIRDYNKCIKCRRCEAVCRKTQDVSALTALYRGAETVIAPAFETDPGEAACISCGQCAMSCPTGAITEREYINEVWAAVEDSAQHAVVQTAPAIQVTLGESFGMPVGTVVSGKLAAALRRIGFESVFSTEFAADLTIIEEAHELLERLEGHGKLPLISSCSPGWVKFCEHFYPEFLDNLSTCKSPQEMLGALTKTYFAEKAGLDPDVIVTVAVMPCTAKKFEAARPEMVSEGRRDVDYVLTTRELARMIRQAGVDFRNLQDEGFDNPLGISTGAGTIFAATGGVMEAAIRTAYALVEDEEMARLEFDAVRGLQGVREADVILKGRTLRIAVAHGTRNAKRLMERIKQGEEFHFLEIMGCPGGCIGGGGQPIHGTAGAEVSEEHRRKRVEALFAIDLGRELRRAHENPAVKRLYEEYLGHPGSERAKRLLHTTYTARKGYPQPDAEPTTPLHLH